MSTSRKPWVFAILGGLVFKPVSMLAASVPNFPPNPVGEKLFRAQMYHEMLFPVVIIGCALVMACLVHILARRLHKPELPQ